MCVTLSKISEAHLGILNWNGSSTMLDSAFSIMISGGIGESLMASLLATNEERLAAMTDPFLVAQQTMATSAR